MQAFVDGVTRVLFAETVNTDRPLPRWRFDRRMLIVVSADELLADGFQIIDEHGFLVAVGDRFVDILP